MKQREKRQEETMTNHGYINPCPLCGGISDGELPDVILGALGNSQFQIKCVPCNLKIVQDRVDKVRDMWNTRPKNHSNYCDGDL